MRRRQFLQATAGWAAACGVSAPAFGQLVPVKEGTVRDRLWVFCNPINADFEYVRKRSVSSPLESAVYLGVPNMIMVNQYPEAGQESWYKPWEPPFEQYAYPLKIEKRVVWSIVDAAGVHKDWEEEQVMAMARRTPNFTGVFMDDFFRSNGSKLASLSLDELREVQRKLKDNPKKLDLYVTLYTEMLNRPLGPYLEMIDVVTFWTGRTAELAHLEENLGKLEKLAPKSRKLLGCYTAEYNHNRTPWWLPMPIPQMQNQCEIGLKWLRDGRIDGIIIYGNFIDLGWDSIEWAREWIAKVGDTPLKA